MLLHREARIADFMLRTPGWRSARIKDRWALPLLAHCLNAPRGIMALILMSRRIFVAFIDFLIHITIDRAKGLCTSTFGVTHEHPWFWTLIGVDQALHHLTGFGLSIFMSARQSRRRRHRCFNLAHM
jgi:hypothetical protein